ncbi:YjgH family [Aspergillus sclerotialis]|uniref:YjgH family n=1 Tax=Aspergillus sclerotialis TaxID=2070753 RepID=A0A3A2ZTS8_9EURO|nr:YjgH family [Aspergillus sclerotialis]
MTHRHGMRHSYFGPQCPQGQNKVPGINPSNASPLIILPNSSITEMSTESVPVGTSTVPGQTNKRYYSTSSPFETQIGYYRAVRHGRQIFVSGTTAVDPKSPPSSPQIFFPGDARQQTRVALTECINAVKALGGKGAESVVRVKMFVSRHEDCPAVGEGFKEILARDGAGIGTTATMIVVNGFIDENMLVEVEVDAIVEDN